MSLAQRRKGARRKGDTEPLLLPAPQNIRIKSGSVALRVDALSVPCLPDLKCWRVSPKLFREARGRHSDATLIPNKSLAEEAYRLTITPDSNSPIRLEFATTHGARNGLCTLAQLVTQCRDHLPALEIEDSPAFPVRGVMLDVSRDRVPTMPHLLSIVDLLASWKINHLQLYTEHTFAYKGHRTIWKDASPLTAADVRRLDQHCHERGVTLAANQNCFGHMERWLKHEEYAPLAETTGKWNCLGKERDGGFSLCPIDPNSIKLVDDLLGQLLPNFSSKLVNIGCDETFDVGQGRSSEAVAERGFAAVYAEFVSRVAAIAQERGFRPMFWADIALDHPESLAMLPRDLIALVWGYEPDSPFDKWCETVKEAGFEFWVCPGTSSWRSITGRTTERRANLRAAAAAGLRYGAGGFLVTDWGDAGHRQQWPISVYGLAEGAAAAWNPLSSFDPDSASLHAFGDASGETGRWLKALGDADRHVRQRFNIRNASALFKSMEMSPDALKLVRDAKGEWPRVSERLDRLRGAFPVINDKLIAAELRHTLEVATFAADWAIARQPMAGKAGKGSIGMSIFLKDRLESIVAEHRRLWLKRSRPGGLDDSCKYYIQE